MNNTIQTYQHLANARLIAAAPELLQALRFASGYIEADVRSQEALGDKQTHLHGARAVLRTIDAAIAKAEGKA